MTHFLPVGLKLSSSRDALCQPFFFLLPSVLQSVLMHSTFGLFYCCFTMQYRKLGLRLGVKLPLFLPKLFFSVSVQFHRSFLFFFSVQKQGRPTSQLVRVGFVHLIFIRCKNWKSKSIFRACTRIPSRGRDGYTANMLGSATKYTKMSDKDILDLRKSKRRRDRLQNTAPLLLLAHGDVFWRRSQNTINVILIEWDANNLRGSLKIVFFKALLVNALLLNNDQNCWVKDGFLL